MTEVTDTKRVWVLVEDEPAIRLMLSVFMEDWGVTPLVFSTGHEAMSWLDRLEAGEIAGPPPELALLDIRVPGPRGPEIARRMRGLPQTAGAALIFMTAYELTERDRACLEHLADAIVGKPLPDPEVLHEMLLGLLAARQTRSTHPTDECEQSSSTLTQQPAWGR
ncbi:MAG: hypothetical protein Kow00124_10830 [Anaerolineae bacterium]